MYIQFFHKCIQYLSLLLLTCLIIALIDNMCAIRFRLQLSFNLWVYLYRASLTNKRNDNISIQLNLTTYTVMKSITYHSKPQYRCRITCITMYSRVLVVYHTNSVRISTTQLDKKIRLNPYPGEFNQPIKSVCPVCRKVDGNKKVSEYLYYGMLQRCC